ncbi:MAG: cell division ATP-binding protein FtsE [Gammaproteobacteria bacterium]|nr:cell division ATP-binding protein FtsE [Gammaproteobacteria bacterium]
MIIFEKVVKKYQDKTALADINFNMEAGEMAFVTGHSGAGKSTLLSLIPGIEKPDRGTVTVADKDIAKLGKNRLAHLRRRIGFVFQQHHLLFDRSVSANVSLPLQICGTTPEQSEPRVRAALRKVGLEDKGSLNPKVLSAGEQQRVGIARAIVNRPLILLADEPTGNLDPTLSAEIMRLFAEFNGVGVTVLIASHDLPLIEQFNYRIIHLRHGEIVENHRD